MQVPQCVTLLCLNLTRQFCVTVPCRSKNQQSRFEIGDQVKIYRGGANSPDCPVIDCKCITA
jgi:hypothetical protein